MMVVIFMDFMLKGLGNLNLLKSNFLRFETVQSKCVMEDSLPG